MTEKPDHFDLLSWTSEIVSSHVSNNNVSHNDIPDLIEKTYQALSGLKDGRMKTEDTPEPAVPVNKSITPDYLICLEDGKKLKMLKRHLKTAYDMSPEDYKERWGLPADYPMVAPNYAKRRSALAKDIGLGKK